jgi:hypothetical protein
MPRDNAAGTDFDHDHVRPWRKAPDARADAAGCGDLPLAGELDPSQTRSITPAIACPNPMHIVATP